MRVVGGDYPEAGFTPTRGNTVCSVARMKALIAPTADFVLGGWIYEPRLPPRDEMYSDDEAPRFLTAPVMLLASFSIALAATALKLEANLPSICRPGPIIFRALFAHRAGWPKILCHTTIYRGASNILTGEFHEIRALTFRQPVNGHHNGEHALFNSVVEQLLCGRILREAIADRWHWCADI